MPSYKNTYTQPSPLKLRDDELNGDTPEEDYDHNYVFEVKALKSDRVELRPFVPSLHSALLLKAHLAAPELGAWLPLELKRVEDVNRWVETTFRRNPINLLYAIFTGPRGPDPSGVDPKDYEFAGCIGMINSSWADMVSEPGWIQIAKPYQSLAQAQRTHVLTHSAGLIIHRVLDTEQDGGLGLRRCQWFTNSLNEASQKAALRLGFKLEGMLRYHRVLGPGKKGAAEARPGDYQQDLMSRDSWLASITWQDWESGAREHIDRLMARKS